jgi:hypothetical protein
MSSRNSHLLFLFGLSPHNVRQLRLLFAVMVSSSHHTAVPSLAPPDQLIKPIPFKLCLRSTREFLLCIRDIAYTYMQIGDIGTEIGMAFAIGDAGDSDKYWLLILIRKTRTAVLHYVGLHVWPAEHLLQSIESNILSVEVTTLCIRK